MGSGGRVTGLDRSPAMLDVARRRSEVRDSSSVHLVAGDATDLRVLAAGVEDRPVDAVVCTYALSVVPDVGAAWDAVRAVVRPGGQVAVVDMGVPRGRWAWAAPVARLACRLGGADVDARPWELLERDLTSVRGWSRWGGHVQVRVGTL